jgi:hypothetical protein
MYINILPKNIFTQILDSRFFTYFPFSVTKNIFKKNKKYIFLISSTSSIQPCIYITQNNFFQIFDFGRPGKSIRVAQKRFLQQKAILIPKVDTPGYITVSLTQNRFFD